MKDKKLHSIGESYEQKSFQLVSRSANRLLNGFFHFKKRKGEIVAGSATLFALLSFCPIILLTISLCGIFMGGATEASQYVLSLLHQNFPEMAPWILKSITKIVNSQLHSSGGFNVLNAFLLVYSTLGVVTSLVFGINTIAKTESRGGFFVEDIRSIVMGLAMATFIGGLMFLSHKGIMLSFVPESTAVYPVWKAIVGYNVLPILASLAFVTLFYQYASSIDIEIKDSLKGAASFVGCFLAGKSFYWIYLLYSKETLAQSYGNFYTLFIAVFWVYYLMCSFFFGASVAYVKYQDIYAGVKQPGPNSGTPQIRPASESAAPPSLNSIPKNDDDENAA